MIDARAILDALDRALRAEPWVLAMWQGGSAASARSDAHSDIDLSIVVEDECVEQTFTLLTQTLEALGRIDRFRRVPEPTWHGHSQCFYHIEGTPPTLLVDCAVMKQSAPDHFLAPEQHGHVVVHFDKQGVVRLPEFDAPALREKLWQAYHRHVALYELFQDVLVPKEIARGRGVDAMQFYHGFMLKPLLHMLGIAYRPLRHDFGRYAREDLPPEIYARLEPLYFVHDLDDLARKQALAIEFFWEIAHAIDIDALDLDAASREARHKETREL